MGTVGHLDMKYSISMIVFFLVLQFSSCLGRGEVVYAVNAGGEAHTDIHGIHYSKDPLNSQDVGIASDFGRSLVIARVPQADQILYQTERYHHSSFGYDIPLRSDGEYVLVMKFSEVYFQSPGQKVFSILLDGVKVVPDLDIYARVGKGVAHQEVVPFKLSKSKQVLFADGSQTELKKMNSIRLEFQKGEKDNPKINAVYVMKGSPQDVPQLPPFPTEEETDVYHEEEPVPPPPGSNSQKFSSGPRTPDPYSTDESTGTFLPLLAAIGAAIPIIFCLCRI